MSPTCLHIFSSLETAPVDQLALLQRQDRPVRHIACSLDSPSLGQKRPSVSTALTLLDNVQERHPLALQEAWESLQSRVQQVRAIQRRQLELLSVPLCFAGRRRWWDVRAMLALNRIVRKIRPDELHVWDEAAVRWCRVALPKHPRIVKPKQSPVQRETFLAREAFLRSLDLPDDAILIGTFGPLVLRERKKDLLWAAELLRVVHERTYLLVEGSGPEEWRLHRFRDQIAVGRRVRFLGNRPDYHDWLPWLDFVWSSAKDTDDVGRLQAAMAHGCIPIASDTAVHRQLISSGQNGFLVPLGDRAEFARRTWLLLQDPNRAEQIRERLMKSAVVTRTAL